MTQEVSAFDQLKADIAQAAAPLAEIRVTDMATAQIAINAGLQVKDYIKKVEKVRKALTDPLLQRQRDIKAYADGIVAPLVEAEARIKRQLADFEIAQEKVRREAQRIADEERRRKESELAARQEQERIEQEKAIALFGGSEEEHTAMEEKQIAEQADLKNEVDHRAHAIAQQGVKNVRKIWKCELVDIDLVPKEFVIRTLNDKAILALAREGMVEIPGVKLWQETSVALGRNTYIPREALEVDGQRSL